MIINIILLSLCISSQLYCMGSQELDVHNQAQLTDKLNAIEKKIVQLASENNSAEFARVRIELDAQLNSISQDIEKSHKWGSIDFAAREGLIAKWRKLNDQFCELIQWTQPQSVYSTQPINPNRERFVAPISSRIKQRVERKSSLTHQRFFSPAFTDKLYKYAVRAGIIYIWYSIFFAHSSRKNKAGKQHEQAKAAHQII